MRLELYPDDWPLIAREVKEACDWTCQVCEAACRRPNDPETAHLPVLTVAHWFHDYEAEAVFVVACCAPCHLAHDRHYHWRNRRLRYWERQRAAGQLSWLEGKEKAQRPPR
jgi:hypothetical protein